MRFFVTWDTTKIFMGCDSIFVLLICASITLNTLVFGDRGGPSGHSHTHLQTAKSKWLQESTARSFVLKCISFSIPNGSSFTFGDLCLWVVHAHKIALVGSSFLTPLFKSRIGKLQGGPPSSPCFFVYHPCGLRGYPPRSFMARQQAVSVSPFHEFAGLVETMSHEPYEAYEA